MAEFKKLPTQEELQRMLYMGQLQGKSNQEIIADNLASGSNIKALPDNFFQKIARGAGIAKEQVNKLGNAADLAKLFPGYTGESQVRIPTDYNFASKQTPTGEVTPQGLQTQQVNINQLLQAIKPADVLGITGAQQAYTDVGMGKAPNPMDVMDVAGLGAVGMGAGKGLLGVAKATKNMPVGMSIKDVTDLSYRSTHNAPSPDFGAPLHDLTGGGQMYPADVYSPKAVQYYGTGFDKADREAFALANKVRGNPDAEVTMYRAVPKNIKEINVGDWVTLSKEYAKVHGQSVLNDDYAIISKKVKAKDLWTNADSIQEFGYNPSE